MQSPAMRGSRLLIALNAGGGGIARPWPQLGLRSIAENSWSRNLRTVPNRGPNDFTSPVTASRSKLTSSALGLSRNNQAPSVLVQIRWASTGRNAAGKEPTGPAAKAQTEESKKSEAENKGLEEGFQLTERAAQAAQINLSAKLGRDSKKKPGWREIWRLLQIARPEAKWLSIAFVCLLISSGITMSIPMSIGKILDIATKGDSTEEVFGLSVPMFYAALAGILVVGAAANYSRIIILRLVGERVVARQRSKLFRRTFIQDAEFFDANRVGDLISRLSSDTLIVAKSITQNLSDGLRAFVSGAAGFGAMAYVSLKLSSVLAFLLPPVGLAAFFYGRAIRNLSRQIQKNLGTLTKIAEERLGNVKTSQAFAGEIQEVHRYNTQVKKIFSLGKREALISASFFSSVSPHFPIP